MADPKNNPPPRVVVASQRLPRRRFKTNLRILIYRPGTFLRFYRWPLVVLAIGAVLDAVTTYRNVSAYGPAAEIHPAARLLWEILGVSPVSVALAKVVQCAFACLIAGIWRRWCGPLLVLAGVLYALAAVSNHFLLL